MKIKCPECNISFNCKSLGYGLEYYCNSNKCTNHILFSNKGEILVYSFSYNSYNLYINSWIDLKLNGKIIFASYNMSDQTYIRDNLVSILKINDLKTSSIQLIDKIKIIVNFI